MTTVGCPLCGRACEVRAHDGAYCARCFHSFPASDPLRSLSAKRRAEVLARRGHLSH